MYIIFDLPNNIKCNIVNSYARDYEIESIENAPGNRGVFLHPRRAHLLTTCYTSGGIAYGNRALSEGKKLDETAEQYQKLSEQAAEVDTAELYNARLALRTDMEHTAHTKLSETYGGKFDSTIYAESRRDVNELLGENITDTRTIKERLQDKHPQQEQQKPKRNKRTHDNSL